MARKPAFIANDRPRFAAKLRSVMGEINAGMAGLSDEELLEVMAAYEAVGRVISALRVRVAGEVEVRSRSELRNEG